MKVQLLAYTPDPERLVASAAKLCYSPVGVSEISGKMTDEAKEKFIRHLVEIGHESTIEHISFTFAVEGVSRALTHQLVRHRIASYSQQSQRYVKLKAFEYIVPPQIESNPQAKALFQKAMEEDQAHYDRLVELLKSDGKERLIRAGTAEAAADKMAEKAALEDARYVFPNACETKIVVTMNARSLMNFFRHRCCNRAQWEIQRLADAMLAQVREVAPSLFSTAGPGCLEGPCPEGSMSCGRIQAVRQKYQELNK